MYDLKCGARLIFQNVLETRRLKMKIIIVGDGKVGATLTEHLSKEGHNVVVIDQDSQVVEEMVNRFDVMGISGNGASCSVLLEAGANKADLLIAATSSD